MPDAEAAALLRTLRNTDGGYPPTTGGESEAEPTALAAIALDDAEAVAWLTGHQADDGGFLTGPPEVVNDSATPLAALALEAGEARDRAIAYLLEHQAQTISFDERFPHDPDTRGWGWTSETFGWVEPTSRALHALKVLARDRAQPEIVDGIRVLEDRECVGGGWNYGNREVLGTDLEPFLQTTAAAVIALHDQAGELRDRGLAVLEKLWPDEQGGLGWAMSLVAFRLCGDEAPELSSALEQFVVETAAYDDAVALGWAAIAFGPGLERLRATP